MFRCIVLLFVIIALFCVTVVADLELVFSKDTFCCVLGNSEDWHTVWYCVSGVVSGGRERISGMSSGGEGVWGLRVLHRCLTEETINLFSASEHQQLHLPTLLLPFRVTGITMGILIGGCMKDEIVSSSAASPEIM